MEDEVEITVIATGFSGGTATDEMKQEVKRNITNSHIEESNEATENISTLEEKKSDAPSSRVEVSDNDIPAFIKKLKNRF